MMLATIHDDTWNVHNMQHIIPNLKRWDYSDIPGGLVMNIIGYNERLVENVPPVAQII